MFLINDSLYRFRNGISVILEWFTIYKLHKTRINKIYLGIVNFKYVMVFAY